VFPSINFADSGRQKGHFHKEEESTLGLIVKLWPKMGCSAILSSTIISVENPVHLMGQSLVLQHHLFLPFAHYYMQIGRKACDLVGYHSIDSVRRELLLCLAFL